MSSRFGRPTKRYAFYDLPSYSPLGDHSDGAFDEPEADSIIVNLTSDDQSNNDLEKRKGGGGGSTGGSRGSGGNAGGNRPSGNGGGTSTATANIRATARFNGGTLGTGGNARPPWGGNRGTTVRTHETLSPIKSMLQLVGGSVRLGFFSYALGAHANENKLEFCQGASELSALKSCPSIGGLSGEEFVNQTLVKLLLSRDSLNSTQSIDFLKGYGEDLSVIADSGCDMEYPLREYAIDHASWLGKPNDWLGASVNTQDMCTERHPELQDTSLAPNEREAGRLRGEEIGQGILELQSQGNLDGMMGQQKVRDYISDLNSTITKTAARRRSDFTDSKSRQAIVSDLDPLIDQYLNMDEGQTGYDPDDKYTKAMSGMMNDVREGRDLTKIRYSLKAADLVLNPVVSDASTSAGNSLWSKNRWALGPAAWAASEAIGLGPVSLLSSLG